MSDNPIHASISPPKRVQILKNDVGGWRTSTPGYWKPNQFGYAQAYSTNPGNWTESGPSKTGELTYLVSKSKDGRGGATWFSVDAIRFTTNKPRELTAGLNDEEKVALDLILQGGSTSSIDRQLSELDSGPGHV